MRRPSDRDLSATMAESAGVAADGPRVEVGTNYRKAEDLLRKISQEMNEMEKSGIKNPERLERLQHKSNDIAKVIELVEHEFENVEEDDWYPKLTTALAPLSRTSVRQHELQEAGEMREATVQKPRTNEAGLSTAALPATAAYRPPESYRPSPEPPYQPPYPPPQAVPRAPSPPSAVHMAQIQGLRPGAPTDEERRASTPSHSDRNAMPPVFSMSQQQGLRPGAPINEERRASTPSHSDRNAVPPVFSMSQQQSFRPGPQQSEKRPSAPSAQPDRNALPVAPTFIEDPNYKVPSNVSFSHGPNFSDCIASMELSDAVEDLEDAQEDLQKAKEKLRKAEERSDAEKVGRYRSRVVKYEKDVREFEAAHWRLEVEPLRRAYRFEILQCLQQLDAAIKYTESLQSELNPATQQEQGQLNVLEEDALHDMELLQTWLQLCLRQPKTWRKEGRLLVGLIEGHPKSSLKDPQFVADLLQEASQQDTSSRQQLKATDNQKNTAIDDTDSERTPKTTMITPDLLEGLLNGAIPKEVAENIQACSVCKGTGGEVDHAKICSECDGAGSSKDSEDGFVELCPKCSGRGFRLSKKYLCPACDGFKVVLRIPREKNANSRDTSPIAREENTAPKSSSSTKRASFEPQKAREPDAASKRSSSTKQPSFEPDVLPDSGKSKKHRDYSSDEASRSPPRSASSHGRRRRQSESRRAPDAAPNPTAALSAVAAEFFKASKEPGSWTGEKGKRLLSAAIAAGTGGGGTSRNAETSDSARSNDEDEDYDEKPRRKRRGSTRH